METEIEIKFPNVDPASLRSTLSSAGAVLTHPERLMKRRNFDYPDRSLEKKGGWIRVREEGDKVTLSYKELRSRTLHGTKEIGLDIGDADKMAELFVAIGFEQKCYQETRRESWKLGDVDVTIDTWPWVPSFVELEGPSEEAVRDAADKLGFVWEDGMHGSMESVYQMVFDVTEEEVDAWPVITFEEIPAEVEARRR
jgi:adenylate cyclase, class 2